MIFQVISWRLCTNHLYLFPARQWRIYTTMDQVPSQGPRVCQIIKTTKNISALFDDDKPYTGACIFFPLSSRHTLYLSLVSFPLSPHINLSFILTLPIGSPFWHHKKIMQTTNKQVRLISEITLNDNTKIVIKPESTKH